MAYRTDFGYPNVCNYSIHCWHFTVGQSVMSVNRFPKPQEEMLSRYIPYIPLPSHLAPHQPQQITPHTLVTLYELPFAIISLCLIRLPHVLRPIST